MELNMAQFGINFGDPKGFADWTKYAGFNANKPMIGIAPPATADAAPVSPTLAQVGERMSNVGTQLGQGNFLNAFKTFQGGAVPANTVAPSVPAVASVNKPMPVDKDGDGMISDWEE
jgi:hypothetical protein